MLARAAQRRLRRNAFASQPRLSEQLTLPWLCPAQMRWAASVGTISTGPNPDSRPQTHTRKSATSLSLRHETRSLATAADIQSLEAESLGFKSFAHAWGTRVPDPAMSRIPRWDGPKPLIVHDITASSLPTAPTRGGIGGNPIELHQNLYACLRVGRMDRANLILKRLADMYDPSAPELVDAHNIYLQTMFDIALENPTKESLAGMDQWYDKQMVRQDIEPNVQTFVTLLRAALNLLQGASQEAWVRKYLDMAYEYGDSMLEDINASAEFSDDEWDALIRLQPDAFDEPPPIEEVQQFQLSTPGGEKLAIQHGLIPDPALNVKPVAQKGMGLKSLKTSLGLFDAKDEVTYPDDLSGTPEEKDLAYAYMRQIRLEADGGKAAVERWKVEDSKLQEIGIHGVLQSKPIQALMWQWYSAMLPRLKNEIKQTKEVLAKNCRVGKTDDRLSYGPWLEQCEPEKLAALVISRVLSACAKNVKDSSSLKLSSLAVSIGRDIEEEVNETLKIRHARYVRKLRKDARQELLAKISKQREKTSMAKEAAAPSDSNTITPQQQMTFHRKEFPLAVKTKIGALVLEHLIQTAMITVSREDPKTGKKLTSTQRAFHHQNGFVNGRRIGWIEAHHEIEAKLRNEPVNSIHHIRLPMLVEPKPWSDFTDGGYYTVSEPAVRTKLRDNEQVSYARSAISNGDLKQMLAGLDVLGKVPWNINNDVFRVMVQAWNAGEDVAGLVPVVLKLERPPELPADATQAQRYAWSKTMKEYDNAKNGFHSNRCFQNFQLEIARAFLNEKFYYPHSVDFRGRAYPVPPILNHIGADISRGLLTFANGKELGEVGLQWLKIHLANLYGYDKASLRDREQFAMDNIDAIYDSATNPLGGKRWWAQAEDPWQCLACCFELKNALDLPDPTRYVSALPVHQDGTCNGLQHYAALGGDFAGATQVNLEPSDRPQDIYTGVAELVKEMVSEDAKRGDHFARFLEGKITRRVVKRTVMTNVYGVTFIGAKLQVLDELKALFPVFVPQERVKSLDTVAMYVAKKIFLALGKIFNGAQEIQYWLGECGDRITSSLSPEQVRMIQDRIEGRGLQLDAKYNQSPKKQERMKKKLAAAAESYNTSIVWTTPLKMPVVQPYRKHPKMTVKTNLQSISVSTSSTAEPVDKRKQLQAFPPNFIHSLDATHMILSALKCHEMGLDFAAVHDSFWTHAADIPRLSTILRDAFVRMHSEDVMGRLAAEFETRYAGHMYNAAIRATSPVAQKISAWRNEFYSTRKRPGRWGETSAEELALEQTRQDLLQSENEEERARGEQMVTPTSIWLANQDPTALRSYRLALLGESKSRGSSTLDEVKNKVLGAEAEAVEQTETATANDQLSVDDVEASNKSADTTKKRFGAEGLVRIWIPLTFPPVPKKGDWNVKRLKESKYFFS